MGTESKADDKPPKPIPTCRQEIEAHLTLLQREQETVRNNIAIQSQRLANSDQQLAGLRRLEADYRFLLGQLPDDDRPRLGDWMVATEQPAHPLTVAADDPGEVAGHAF